MERVIVLSTIPLCLVVTALVIAFIVITWLILKFVKSLWTYFLSYYCGSGAQWCGGPNVWAVVTGATDGIGLAYAKAMAQKGYSLVLLSRNLEKLNNVKKDIENNYKDCHQIRVIAVDFSRTDIYERIEQELKELEEIHVLINNVGMTYRFPEYFVRLENRDQLISDLINVNINAMTRMINIVLPMMVKNERGIILNLASYSVCFPTPLLAVYSASKIYGDYLSRALNAEYADKNIIIQSVVPYYVSTNMIRNPKISFMTPDADRFVKSALTTVGIETRTYGYFPHTVIAFFQNFFVKFLIGNDFNVKLAYRKMKKFRSRYLTKRTRYINKGLDSII